MIRQVCTICVESSKSLSSCISKLFRLSSPLLRYSSAAWCHKLKFNSRTPGSLKNSSRHSTHIPDPNAGSQPEFYSSLSTITVPGGRPRSEPCLLAPGFRTNSKSEFGPPKPSCRGTDRADTEASLNLPTPPPKKN